MNLFLKSHRSSNIFWEVYSFMKEFFFSANNPNGRSGGSAGSPFDNLPQRSQAKIHLVHGKNNQNSSLFTTEFCRPATRRPQKRRRNRHSSVERISTTLFCWYSFISAQSQDYNSFLQHFKNAAKNFLQK